MQKLNHKPKLIKLLEEYRYLRMKEISELLNMPIHRVGAMVNSLRKTWAIRTSKKGYTLRNTPSIIAYEVKLRCKNCYGNINNVREIVKLPGNTQARNQITHTIKRLEETQ